MSPRLTVKPLRLPSPPRRGVPVVRVTRSLLMKPQPVQVMPLGLATITSALPPSTSVKPASVLRLVDDTSLMMTRASPSRLVLASTWPASCDCRAAWLVLPLLSTSPLPCTS